jgi:PST family polysaccharide transporter
VAILLLVHRPEDGWKVLAMTGTASLIAAAVAYRWACREVPLRSPGWHSIRRLYASAWPLFSYRAAQTLYSTANPFLLGLLAPASAVGYFGGADRIARAFLAVVNPLAQTVYPRISYLAAHSKKEAVRFSRIALFAGGFIGLASGTVVWLGAPLWIQFLLGAAFSPAIPALRVLALLCPLIAINTVLAFVWLLPRYLDRRLNRLTLCAGGVNLGLALWAAPRYWEIGMAWAVVCAEIFVLFGLILSVRSPRPKGRRTAGEVS